MHDDAHPVGTTATEEIQQRKNADFAWDDFDPVAYQKHNYEVLRADDRQILSRTRDFFVLAGGQADRHGVDVGSGANLYPALSMLPWCQRISMVEYSAGNVGWLRREVADYSSSWDPYWDVLCEAPDYTKITEPRRLLAERSEVRKGSVFELPRREWDLGTMYFVAESISSRRSEFVAAVSHFLDALRPGAPFATAFMEGSLGYQVGDHEFPAVPIEVPDLLGILQSGAEQVVVERIGMVDTARRVG
nr:SCO2525 family SAM-dependent methyltransferase [Micromonospora sp. DSM 115978]